MVVMTHTNFGLNTCVVEILYIVQFGVLFVDIVHVLFQNGFTNQLEFHNFLSHWSKDDVVQFLWKMEQEQELGGVKNGGKFFMTKNNFKE